MWALISGELAIFGGLIASFILYRFRYEEWNAMAAMTNTTLGAANTFNLLLSSYFVVLGHAAAAKKDIQKTTLWIGLTLLCALIFLGIKSVEYSQEFHHGYTIISTEHQETNPIGTLYWTFYFAMTGFHALHVIVGALSLGIVLLGVRKGENFHRIEIAGMYWHMVDLIWIFLFPLLYLAK
jgi:heme/copper-type cytochrome/quinol oxidase subunit 3